MKTSYKAVELRPCGTVLKDEHIQLKIVIKIFEIKIMCPKTDTSTLFMAKVALQSSVGKVQSFQ